MAATQKKKNVHELHAAAQARGFGNILEISSKSEREVGRKLSAFHQKVPINGQPVTLECVFQGSKVFERGGPFVDLFSADPRDAKRDERLKNSGRLVKFVLNGSEFPLTPSTAFYDWLYIKALHPHRDWLHRLVRCGGFTDIEFNPERSINCQARSCATFVALQAREILDEAVASFDGFRSILSRQSI